MMDLIQNLMARGGGQMQTPAPTDMSQIKVQPQAMDLAGTIPAANAQLDFNKPQAPGMDWGAAGKAALGGLAASMGGGEQQQPAPMQHAPQYRGGATPDPISAEKLSGANLAQLQQFAQVGGLLSKR